MFFRMGLFFSLDVINPWIPWNLKTVSNYMFSALAYIIWKVQCLVVWTPVLNVQWCQCYHGTPTKWTWTLIQSRIWCKYNNFNNLLAKDADVQHVLIGTEAACLSQFPGIWMTYGYPWLIWNSWFIHSCGSSSLSCSSSNFPPSPLANNCPAVIPSYSTQCFSSI